MAYWWLPTDSGVALVRHPTYERKNSLLYGKWPKCQACDFIVSGGIAVVDIALEQINNTTEILPNHTLRYTEILDSNVS